MLPEEQKFLEELYRENFGKVLSHIKSLLHANCFSKDEIDSLAEEMTQDVFHTASRRIDVVFSHPNPIGWLINTGKYKYQEYMRKFEAQSRWFLPSNDILENLPSHDHNPTAVLDHMTYDDVMTKIRRNLSEEDYRLFHMVILNHFSHKVAAKELGITVWASQKRVSRIRDHLQKLLSP